MLKNKIEVQPGWYLFKNGTAWRWWAFRKAARERGMHTNTELRGGDISLLVTDGSIQMSMHVMALPVWEVAVGGKVTQAFAGYSESEVRQMLGADPPG